MNSPLRTEINKIILKLPENKLKPVLEYLKQVEKTTSSQLEMGDMLKKIFEEDKELLKKLAQ